MEACDPEAVFSWICHSDCGEFRAPRSGGQRHEPTSFVALNHGIGSHERHKRFSRLSLLPDAYSKMVGSWYNEGGL